MPVEPPCTLGKRVAAAMAGAKLKRINWGKGEALERIFKAVNDWDGKTGPILEADKDMLLPKYAWRSLTTRSWSTLGRIIASAESWARAWASNLFSTRMSRGGLSMSFSATIGAMTGRANASAWICCTTVDWQLKG